MLLTVPNGRLQGRGVEVLGHSRETFVGNRRDHEIPGGAVEGFAKPHVIHVVVFHLGGQEETNDFGEGQGAVESGPGGLADEFGVHAGLVF